MAWLWLLLLASPALGCDSVPDFVSKTVYVDQAQLADGRGSECDPFSSLSSAFSALSALGGSITLLSSVESPSASVLSDVRIVASVYRLTLTGPITVSGNLTIDGGEVVSIGERSDCGFRVEGLLVLTHSSATGFAGTIVSVSGRVEIEGGTYSGNRGTVVVVSGSEAIVIIKNSKFSGNSGEAASVIQCIVTTGTAGTSLPEVTLEGVTVEQESEGPVVNVNCYLGESSAVFGVVRISRSKFLSKATQIPIVIHDGSNIEIIIDNVIASTAAFVLKVLNTNAPVTVSNSTFTSVSAAIHIEGSSSLITLSNISCTWCVQAVSIASPAARCHISDVVVSEGGGSAATLQAMCNTLTTSKLIVHSFIGAAINFTSISNGTHSQTAVSNCSAVGGTIVTLTDSESSTGMQLRDNFAGVAVLNIKGSRTFNFSEFLIDNCTSAHSLILTSDSCSTHMSRSRLANSYSEHGTFTLNPSQSINTYDELELDGVASGEPTWILYSIQETSITNSRFYFRNSSQTIIYPGPLFFNITNLELTGTIDTFYKDGLVVPVFLKGLDFHDLVCEGLFLQQLTTMFVEDSVFRNVTAGVGRTQKFQKLIFRNVTFIEFVGRLLIMTSADLVLTHALFVNCLVTGLDSLMSASSTTVIIEDAQFINFSGMSPGAMFDLKKNSNFTVKNATFQRLEMLSDSSFISVVQSKLSLDSVLIDRFNSSMIEGSAGDILLLNSEVRDGSASRDFDGGIIRCENCVSVMMESCRFARITASSGGVVSATFTNPVYFAPQNRFGRHIVIVNSTFEDCKASANGGVLFVADGSAFIHNNTFSRNRAFNGGVLYLQCAYFSTSYFCNYTLADILFQDNYAISNGGGYAYRLIKPFTSNITDINNTAKYGELEAGYPVSMHRLESNDERIDVESGVIVHGNLHFGLFDLHDQLVITESASPATVVSITPSANLVSVTRQFPRNGVYYFDSFSIVDEPGSSVDLLFQSEALDYLHPDPNSNITPKAVPLTANLRLCAEGEIQVTKQCVQCAEESYSFNTSDTSCANCMVGMKCLGGASVLLDPGYWRPHNLSASLFKCPFESNCLGKADSECADGYEGRLCTVCSTDYFRLNKFRCYPCPSASESIAQGVGVCFVFIVLLAYITYGALSSAERHISAVGPLTRILLNYIQTYGLITNLDLEWPHQLLKFAEGVALTGRGPMSAFSISCLHQEIEMKEVYLKLVAVTIIPVPLILMSFGIWGVVAICKKQARFVRDQFLCSVIVILLAVHPNILSSTLELMACKTMEENTLWLIVDFREECWRGDHLRYITTLALPAFLVWVVAAPLTISILLVKSRRHKERKSVKVRYSFLVSGYKEKCYYWEFVMLIRKTCMLTLQNTLSSSSIVVQIFSAFMLVWVFFEIQITVSPFLLEALNIAESLAIISVMINTVTGLLLTYGKSKTQSWETFVVFLYLLSSCVFFAFWLISMVLAFRDRLVRKFPFLARIFPRLVIDDRNHRISNLDEKDEVMIRRIPPS